MGSGVTKCDTIKEIECPENYDERSFQKILTIYNKIQKTDDVMKEKDEISTIAKMHINKKKDLLNKKKILIENTKHKKVLKLNTELQKAQKQLISQHIQALSDLNKVASDELRKINYKIGELNSLTENEKQDIILKKISNKSKEVDFWLFFNYMKDKVNDMENIIWTPTNKPRKSSLLIRIKSPNTRPSEYTKKFEEFFREDPLLVTN